MRRATTLTLLFALVLTSGLAAWPQDEPVQQESVLLRLKFAPGETMRYRVYAKADGLVRMDMPIPIPMPEAQMPGQVPVDMVIQGEGAAKVLRVDEAGAGRLSIKADSMSLKMNMFGQKLEMSLKGGKYVVKQDGEQVEAGKIPLAPAGEKIPFVQEPIEVKLSPRGQVLDLVIPGLEEVMATMMQGLSLEDLMKQQVLLPEEPLTVGQTWGESKTEMVPGLNAPVTYDVKATLRQIEAWSGERKIANLRVEATTSAHDIDLSQMMQMPLEMQQGGEGMPPMPQMAGTMSIDQQLAGTMLFDATRGILIRFDFQVDQQMSMRSTTAMPEQGELTMSMDMRLAVKGAVAKI